MRNIIGIRKETKYNTERRAPLTPTQVKKIVEEFEIDVHVQPSGNRIFNDEEYKKAGAVITNDLSQCKIIFGVKEVKIDELLANKAYCFFSHTIKGQSYNMPMLKNILDKNITLIDYELVKNDEGKRIIFFGKYAGYAGMIDSLWLLGRRYLAEGIDTPFKHIKQANKYASLNEAKKAIKSVGELIAKNGLPVEVTPVVTGFTGYGNVSKGAQEVYDLLPAVNVNANELESLITSKEYTRNNVYKVEFTKNDIYENISGKKDFDSKYVNEHPSEFRSIFHKFIPYLTVIINGIFWAPEFDKLITKKYMKELFSIQPKPKIKIIGDVTCDPGGSDELLVKVTKSDNPSFVYEPLTGNVIDGWEGNGPVVLGVDILPAELPVDSSGAFGNALLPFIKSLAGADYSESYENLNLPREFCHAVIAHQGKLTPDFEYLLNYLA